jgi:hypothetical protein
MASQPENDGDGHDFPSHFYSIINQFMVSNTDGIPLKMMVVITKLWSPT